MQRALLGCPEVSVLPVSAVAHADRYVAQLTGLLPEDPWAAALADQAYFFCEDVWQTV